MLFLVNDVLDIGRIQSSNFEINPTKVEFSKFISQIDELFAYQCKLKGIKFKVKVSNTVKKSIIEIDEL